jgi:hypothetical protein
VLFLDEVTVQLELVGRFLSTRVILIRAILEILAVESDQSSKMKAAEFFNTFPMSLDSFFQ